jgi:hypothetical protein
MARFQGEVADTVWVLAKLLKHRVVSPEDVKLSTLVDTKETIYPLRKSSELANIVRKLPFEDSECWLLGRRYVPPHRRLICTPE